MDYSKTTTLKEPIANLLKPFAERASVSLPDLVDHLFAKYIIDDYGYHDDMYYFGIMKFFEQKVIPHKIAVYEAGIELVAQEWFMDLHINIEEFFRNLVRHDLSKFSAAEAFGYACYDPKSSNSTTKAAFDRAWHHHKMNNPHHPEYWLNPNRSGELKIQKMPTIYILEMIADWIGAGKTYDSTLEKWIPENLHQFVFHPDILDLIQQILLRLGIKTHKSGNGLYTLNTEL